MKNGRYFAMVPREQIAGLPTGSAIDTKVWLVIRSFAFDRLVARDVGYSEIAKLVGIDRKNVPRSVRRLEAGGFLNRVRGGPRGHTKNIYLLPTAAGDDLADAETSVPHRR
jgi:DNA-binding MarR family transcriptional regulator